MEHAVGPSEYLSLLRARWWAVVLIVLIGATTAGLTAPGKSDSDTTVSYVASTTLVRGQSTSLQPTDGVNLGVAATLAGSGVVVERSAAELGVPPAALASGLSTIVVDKVGTLQISSSDTNPEQAIAEANAVAAHLITYMAERRQQQLDPLIVATNDRIASLNERLKTIDAQILPPGTQADLQRTERESVLRQLGSNYDRLQQLNEQATGAENDLEVLSPASAVVDTRSDGFAVPDSRWARGLIGALLGLVVGVALVLLLEHLKPSIRTVAQAESAFGQPVIAEIPAQRLRWGMRRVISVFADPYSVAAESYRSLRTALWYIPRANGSHPEMHDRFTGGHVVLVTSASPGDGKTSVVANLAAAFAEKDGDVVVVSGDARQPEVEPLLLGRRAAGARLAAKEQSDTVLTMIPGVKLVLSCDPNSNPADIVGYESKIARRERSRSQIVVIDTPPALIANDASELMQTADSIVLVARCGSTSISSARRLGDLVARMRVPVVGVVLIGTADAGADSHYYRKKPARRLRRMERVAPPPSVPSAHTDVRVDPTQSPRDAEPSPEFDPPTPSASATHGPEMEDDGGIWRRTNGTIDLNGTGDNLPVRAPLHPEPVSARPSRTRMEDPSRGRATAGDAAATEAPAHRGAAGPRDRLPLFRAGDGLRNGNGH
jgi:Mrp family chromosome partitioning ATPase